MSWFDYQRVLCDLVLAEDPAPSEFEPLLGDARRWQAYRRMIRSRFYQTIDHAFERLIAVIGIDRFHAMVDRFVADAPPRSPYLRDLPAEFLAFVSGGKPLGDWPPYALDLMRYEWAELDVAYSHEEVRADDVVALEMDRVAVLSPAHRLLDLDHPVHRIGTDGAGVPVERAPTSLVVYRDRKTHEVETLELTPVAASMLEAMERGTAALTRVVKESADRHGLSIDVAFVDALSTLLADLSERGVLLGSRGETETSR